MSFRQDFLKARLSKMPPPDMHGEGDDEDEEEEELDDLGSLPSTSGSFMR